MTQPYTCYRVKEPLLINGRLDKRAWQLAPKSPRFVDMVSGEPGFFDTRAAALWDDTHFYVAFWVEEPFLQADLSERDSLIFQENDVELFIDGGDCYYEFEINALGTIYEVFFIWRDAFTRGSRFDVAEFDVMGREAVTFGGNFDRDAATFWRGTHPRGLRWAFLDWDFPGLQTAVSLDGTLNDNRDLDKGWFVEMALPWAGMNWLANGRSLPPQNGDEWRMFFGRFQKLLAGGTELEPHPAWCWTPHGIYDTHRPESFTRVQFSTVYVDE